MVLVLLEEEKEVLEETSMLEQKVELEAQEVLDEEIVAANVHYRLPPMDLLSSA